MSITEKLQAHPLRQSRVKTKSRNENRLELGSAQLPKTKSRCRAVASERCGCQRLGWHGLGSIVSKENRKYLFRIRGSCFNRTAGDAGRYN